MITKCELSSGVAAVSLAVALGVAPTSVSAQQSAPVVSIGATDIGGVVSGPNLAKEIASREPAASVVARRSASRVLPAPPAPVSVSSRPRRNRSAHRARSPARPTNELISAGRLPRIPS